ncbi:MAG: hypothetical protein MUC86_03360 [Burkholderiaceae bacterium]|jgi:hypothetical protein|nr:hypothetical protein [Burkholderiaceae bacterium]
MSTSPKLLRCCRHAARGLLPLALILGAGVATAGQYDQPYGLIESGDRSQTRKQEPVAISRIDGESPRNPRRPDPVAPGKRSVQVSFSSARAVVADDLQTIEIDVQPCKRYRLVAAYETAVTGKWKPVVQAVEDIGECKRKFMATEGKK